MAELIETDELGEIEAVEQSAEQVPETKEKSLEVPEKYRGKSVEDVIKMHQETEKALSRQAQEVGEVRKLADELLRSQMKPKEEPEKQEVDFYENPQEAIRQAVENNPKLQAASLMAAKMAAAEAKRTFEAKHPDAGNIIRDEDFQNWVKASPVRIQLFQMADAYNVDAADELLSTYKQIKVVAKTKSEAEEKQTRQASMKAASIDSGGSGESGRKVYRRADLIRLRMTNPHKYESMIDDIQLAYAEGRVK